MPKSWTYPLHSLLSTGPKGRAPEKDGGGCSLGYALMDCGSRLFSRFSPRGLDRLARFLAFTAFSVLRLRRRLILANIGTALGKNLPVGEAERIAALSYYHFALTVLEFLAERQGGLGDQVAIEGGEHIQAALAQKAGVYILCIHMGSWEAMASAMTRQLTPSHVIVKRVGSPGVDRFVTEQRARNGFFSVARRHKGDALRAIASILKKGEIVGFVMDQARPQEPFLPFFGRPARTNTSFAAIWRRHRAPIVPAFIRRTAVGRHTLTFCPELRLAISDDAKADVLTHSAQFNEVVEMMIQECPEQYFWAHNRWKA